MELNNIAIIQARLGSTRLPKKVLKKIRDKTLLEILIARLNKSKTIDKIVVATTDEKSDDELIEYLASLSIETFRGSRNNVLDRYYNAALKYKAKNVVRITGDCPLIDPSLVDNILECYHESDYDYLCNNYPPTFPDGLDVEVFSFSALEFAHDNAKDKYDLEHVTPFMRKSSQLKKSTFTNDSDLSFHRWTIDEELDFKLIKNIFNYFEPNVMFGWKEVLNLYEKKPEIFDINQNISRNEGSQIGTGQKLYKRAKNIIPGGTMLLSKKPEMFLPNLWPAYYSKAKGCKVYDLDNKEFIDMSIMAIGTNILGYCNEEVDNAVMDAVSKGNMSTLNCPEEVYLAEELVRLHKWADMVRFARSGGEANAIAIRIARAASGRDQVAFCGYHGWHDWYLSTNLKSDSNLNNHLLPGLKPLGVPTGLKNTAIPFTYNNIVELQEIIYNNNIGVIKMEVSRSFTPEQGYLEAVRKLANENDIILIFDECTSGFRETFGGLHKKYNVEPDMAMFGKALGNGYAITAVIGCEDVMKFADETFISSTFWTERIGSVAALKTLQIMEKEKSWNIITEMGKSVNEEWKKLALKYNLTIKVFGLPSMTSFQIESKNWIKYKTYITQEMLKSGYLATNTIYFSIAHTKDIVNGYIQKLDEIFKTISKCEDGKNIDELLENEVCYTHFGRLN